MRWIATFVAFLALACAACTSSSGDPPSPTLTAPHTTASVPAPVTSSMSVAPPQPTRPSVPADVPRTGPNTKPGEKPPVMPLEATQHTPEGAKAFAEFFIKTIDWGYATTSSTYMRHYFTRCSDCDAVVRTINKDARLHHRYIGGRLVEQSATLVPVPRNARVVVTVDGTAREVVTQHGDFVSADPAHPGLKFGVTTRWMHAQWQVVDLGVVV
ncbi:MAG TPA: DUF6318 family protein [Jatrophihabitans sp.]